MVLVTTRSRSHYDPVVPTKKNLGKETSELPAHLVRRSGELVIPSNYKIMELVKSL